MKIAIVGAGAMGSLIGGLLAKNGESLYFLDSWQDNIDEINKNGLYMEVSGEEGEYVNIAQCSTDPKEIGPVDAIIFLVKGTNTISMMNDISPMLKDNTLVLTLQNGLGNPEKIATIIDEENVAYGVIDFSSVMLGPGRIRYQLADSLIYGKTLNNKQNIIFEDLVSKMNDAGINFKITDEADEKIWSKLVINGVYNALCGVVGVQMGELMDVEEGQAIMKDVTKEIVDVANAKGINLDFEDSWNHVITLGKKVSNHYPSLSQDVARKVYTEIDSLNGAIASEGRKVNVPTPYNDSIYKILRTIEETYDVGKEFNIM